MNRLGKGQDTVFEALEKGNFIAPPGGDDRDQEDISKLRRAMEWLLPGLALGAFVPHLAKGWELAAFLGGLITLFGCVRIWEENGWFRLAMWCAVAQVLGSCVQLIAQAAVPALLDTAVYSVAGYVSVIAGAAVPVVLTVALWSYHRRNAAFMAITAAVAVTMPALAYFGVMAAVRALGLAVGAGALVRLLVLSKDGPAHPE